MASDTLTPQTEKLLVCLGPGSSSTGLINATRRMAADLKAKWYVLFVEDPKTMLLLPEKARDRISDNLRLAEQWGAETFTLPGRHIAEEIITFAGQRKITRIVVGKPGGSPWKKFLLKSPVDKLVRMSGETGVYVLSGESGEQREATYTIRPQRIPLADYGASLVIFILASLLCFLMFPYFHLSNLIMIYLLGVMITAASCGRGPAILGSLLSVLGFDFFFVPPRFSITVEEAQYIVTFIVMFLVALVISHLANRLRQQAHVAQLQERQATAMHGLSRQLAATRGTEKMFQVAVHYISEIFEGQCMAMVPNGQGKFNVIAGDPSSVLHQDIVKEIQIAHAAFTTGQIAGLGTESSPTSENLYVPIRAADSTSGVLVLRPKDRDRFRNPDQLNLLESLTKQIALTLEVERLAECAKSEADELDQNPL
jgi:two-component system, OmpR family, sensor histidine kinase KdpD